MALILLGILVITWVLGLFFFGFAGFFRLVGVDYTSSYVLIGFVIFFLLIGSLLDVCALAFIGLFAHYVRGKYSLFIIRMAIDCSFTWLALHEVDEWLNQITIPWPAELLAALFLFMVDVALDEKKVKPGS
ncbi:hypothetical protein GCM10011391_40100 [Pullulanibacillus camelliae]|uniref:Uncharacterized protein n=1 Tax=Pullulanibacillus camelliae TaxID=1707096 RepID=A0A8J2YP75_9BACL|nr:hypothetical protein GCM10011391_40100 [Pullulanibacillus camelliae]